MLKYAFAIAVITAGTAFADNRSETTGLSKEVRHELVMLPFLDVFDNLTYSVDGAAVVLGGQVTKPILRSTAEKAVKSLPGVETVDNRIEVLPVSFHDDRLRKNLYRAIYGYPALNRYALSILKPICIIVSNGHATLEGVVDNQMDKNLVGMRANGVHGPFSVTNNLQVEK